MKPKPLPAILVSLILAFSKLIHAEGIPSTEQPPVETASPENQALARSFAECASLITITEKIGEQTGKFKLDKQKLDKTVGVYTLFAFALIGSKPASAMLAEAAKNEAARIKEAIGNSDKSYAEGLPRRLKECSSIAEQHAESLTPKVVEMLGKKE